MQRKQQRDQSEAEEISTGNQENVSDDESENENALNIAERKSIQALTASTNEDEQSIDRLVVSQGKKTSGNVNSKRMKLETDSAAEKPKGKKPEIKMKKTTAAGTRSKLKAKNSN